jgi:hypothetical protein
VARKLSVRSIMPRKLPDIADIDPAKLEAGILRVLEAQVGPRARDLLRGNFSNLVEAAGGARRVLAQALTRIRQRADR